MTGILASLSGLSFLNPWILAGLIALPALWFLLRVIPPAPRIIRLPTVRLMTGLKPDDRVSAHTPWWILLLRLCIAALVLLALARPVINPAESLNLSGTIRIVMENGWASAQIWGAQQSAAEQILDRAARDRMPVIIMPTAPDPGRTQINVFGPMPAGEARSIIRGMEPRAWPAQYGETEKTARAATAKDSIHSFWIGHGLRDGDDRAAIGLARALQQGGSLTYLEPEAAGRPLLLLSAIRPGQDMSVTIAAAAGTPPGIPVAIDALGNDGRVIDRVETVLGDGTLTAATLSLPGNVRTQIARMQISGRGGAGSAILIDDQYDRRNVGIATTRKEGDSAPLTEDSYFIDRALSPYAAISTGAIDTLVDSNPAMIVLPDIGAIPPDTLNRLQEWVKGGGLLLRFGGPNMTQNESFLTPMPLMRGGRAMDGSLTWEKPETLQPFAEDSPFYGLDIPADLEIRRQILAAPSGGGAQIWAALTDGTPLVTAAPMDDGLLVMVHTTASPAWSNLALSGLYVQMLRRVVALAGQKLDSTDANGTLQPMQIMTGRGALQPPDTTVEPIDARAFDTQMPDSRHPPGFYGHNGITRALNIGERVTRLTPMPALPAGVARAFFGGGHETDLMPWLLAAALALFLVDWVIMMVLQSPLMIRLARVAGTAAVVTALCIAVPHAAMAQDNAASAIKYATGTWLAQIGSGDETVDAMAKRGLENLARVLATRTSVEPAGVAMVNPETDEMAFFPLIYWPISPSASGLSDRALRNIQYYLDHGGTIIFDTRDAAVAGLATGTTGRNQIILRNLVAGLNVPPLTTAPDDHVLTRSFYLLESFPGRYDNKNLWVEEQGAIGRDGVSSVIVGGNDWIAIWAEGNPLNPTRSQEMAYRFGVNLVMYALTGNYKADQVHVPYILERLGQ